jgi:hypothetical protein
MRSAPILSPQDKQQLATDLKQRIAACDWFTIGVMAPTANDALISLRQMEAFWNWLPLQFHDSSPLPQGPVFLKGNQRTGKLMLRFEEGLGEGLLISGQAPSNPAAEDTWGPLPLDFFK